MKDIIWAPWRIGFLVGPKPAGCFMCEAIAAGEDNDEEALLLERGERAFVIMNRYPYTNGHLLIAPREHHGDYPSLDPETLAEIGRLSQLWMRVVGAAMNPNGFNLGWNIGKAAGAGVADHLHQHLVPRWDGDHNFMSVCADTRLVNQSLQASWALLRQVRASPP